MKIIGMILVAFPLLIMYIIDKIEYLVNKGMDGFGYTGSERW